MNDIKNWKDYIKEFIANDEELYFNDIPNEKSLEFLEEQIPIIELPDKIIERTYYFRWWTYRKHIKKTISGYVITEFLPEVPWSTEHNTISCAANFHIREGRWLKDSEGIIKNYVNFWLTFPKKCFHIRCGLLLLWKNIVKYTGTGHLQKAILRNLKSISRKGW